jgi:hypothetical protein
MQADSAQPLTRNPAFYYPDAASRLFLLMSMADVNGLMLVV